MARELKFRAWSHTHKVFVYGNPFDKYFPNFSGTGTDETFYWFRANGNFNDGKLRRVKNVSIEDCEIQQFTGLHDKNGKEIYERDIVKWTHPMEDIGVCKYFATEAFAPLYPDQCYFGLVVNRLGICHFQADDIYEIIGNIFENPELLK